MRQPLVVTTEYRGVFFGYGDPDTLTADKRLRLEDAQICLYWSADVKGVLGLASKGASKDCRVSAPIPAITLEKVTSIMETTKEAEKAWKTCPFSK